MMSVDLPPDSQPEKKKKTKARRSQLKVVFDSNALYTESASDLVRSEIAAVISSEKHADLEILWHLPEIVRHERQYQMQLEALKLRRAIDRIERLLGHNLALTDQVLRDHVKTKIEEKESELGLQEIKLNHTGVDWPRLIHAAAYRLPPFEAGEKEKGFRDALVAESFLQLLAASPKTPAVCRVVLITKDGSLTQAVKERIAESPNASVLANIEELKELINTIVSNVGEDFIAQIKPKAARLFFVSSEDQETLVYRENIIKRLEEKFRSELQAKPEGTTFRDNGKWRIHQPNFSRKEGRRVYWISRIEIEIEAGTVTREELKSSGYFTDPLMASVSVRATPLTLYGQLLGQPSVTPEVHLTPPALSAMSDLYGSTPAFGPAKKVVSHKGMDIFEVLWSTEVTPSKQLKKSKIEDIVHAECIFQPIS